MVPRSQSYGLLKLQIQTFSTQEPGFQNSISGLLVPGSWTEPIFCDFGKSKTVSVSLHIFVHARWQRKSKTVFDFPKSQKIGSVKVWIRGFKVQNSGSQVPKVQIWSFKVWNSGSWVPVQIQSFKVQNSSSQVPKVRIWSFKVWNSGSQVPKVWIRSF